MRKTLLIIGIILVIGIIGLLMVNGKILNKNEENKIENCDSMLAGGSFEINFLEPDGKVLSSISVCIACPPSTYEELPVFESDGFVFDGWYYDKDLKEKVTVNSTKDINPVYKYDKNGCPIGYKPINLYAKWKNKD